MVRFVAALLFILSSPIAIGALEAGGSISTTTPDAPYHEFQDQGQQLGTIKDDNDNEDHSNLGNKPNVRGSRNKDTTVVAAENRQLATTTPAWRTVSKYKAIENHENCFVLLPSNKKAYLIGGRTHSNVCEYNPSQQTWDCATRKKPPILMHHMQCVVVNDEIYIASAWSGEYPRETNVAKIYIYKPSTDTWRTETGMASDRLRGAAAAAYHNGFIYVSHGNRGGHGKHSTALTYFDKYDVTKKIWTALPNAFHKRDHTGGGIVNGNKFCVAAGRDGGLSNGVSKVVKTTECYDLVGTKGWTIHANITGTGRSASAYGTTCDGKLMVAGGEGFGMAHANVDIFNGTAWQAAPSLQQARHGTGLAVSCECNQIHIAAGSPLQGGYTTNTTETLFADGIVKKCQV